jgi:hypothetical protein
MQKLILPKKILQKRKTNYWPGYITFFIDAITNMRYTHTIVSMSWLAYQPFFNLVVMNLTFSISNLIIDILGVRIENRLAILLKMTMIIFCFKNDMYYNEM